MRKKKLSRRKRSNKSNVKLLVIPLVTILATLAFHLKTEPKAWESKIEQADIGIQINDEMLLSKALDIVNYKGENIQALYVEEKPKDIEETEETAKQKEEVKAYTDEDLEVLTRVLTGEAHTYSDEHQLLVGSVVLNRVKSNKFPNTIKEVVFQKGQYACVRDGNYYREPTERNIANAKYLLENGSMLPENCVYQAEFKQGSGVYKKIGGTYICYE